MALTYIGDISSENLVGTDACSDSNNLYACFSGTNAAFESYSWNGLALNYRSTLSSASIPTGVTLINSSSAVLSYGATRNTFVNLSNGWASDITTNALSSYTTNVGANGQQIAGNKATGYALQTTSTAGKVNLLNASNQSITTLSPTGLTSYNSVCVVTKADSSTWLVGTSNATIIEVDINGNTLSTITIPTTNNVGSTPTVYVTGLSYYNGILVAATERGFIYTYKYASKTLLNIIPSVEGTNTAGVTLCPSASGFALVANKSTSGAACTVELFFNYAGLQVCSSFFHEFSVVTASVGIEPTVNKAYAVFTTTGSGTSLFQPHIRIFNMYTNPVNVNTRTQYPIGTDVSPRIIRYRFEGNTGLVESDQNVSSGIQPVIATDNHNYSEVTIFNSSGNQIDFRGFST